MQMSSGTAHSARTFLTLALAALALANCDCGEVVSQIPQPEIGIINDVGDVHTDADPWMVIGFGDADTGQVVTKNLQLKNIGGGSLRISEVCLVNAADLATAVAPTTACLGANTAPFVFPLVIGSEIKADAFVDLPVTFRPTAGGPASVFLRVGSDANDEPFAAVQLTGRGTDGRLCADPIPVDFGEVAIGTTATQTVTISNCGIKPITIDSYQLTSPDGVFAVTRDGVAPSAPIGPMAEGETFVLTVTFSPTRVALYLDANAGDIGMTTAAPFADEYHIPILARAIEPPSCRVNVVPQTVNFGGVAANTSQTRQVIVQSVGQCACTLSAFAGPTPGDVGFAIPTPPALPLVLKGTTGCAADPAGAASAPSSISVDVVYTAPDRPDAVRDNATIDVTTDAAVDPVRVVNLEANGGGAPFCQLSVTPQFTQTFQQIRARGRTGLVEFGRSSIHIEKRLPLTLENVGNARCNVSDVELDANTTDNEFRVENEDGSAVTGAGYFIDPGQVKRYTVVFEPTRTLESDNPLDVFSFGSYSGSTNGLCAVFGTQCNGITFTTDDTASWAAGANPDLNDFADDVGVFSVGFSATPVEPSVDIIPSELDFGLVTLDCGSPERRTTIYNTGSLPLSVGQPFIDADTTPPTFAVTATTNPGDSPTNTTSGWPFELQPGASMSIAVRYFARSVAIQDGLLVVPTFETENGNQVDGPPLTVALRGEGTLDRSQTDIFDQARDPTVDVLFVVDDSGSMSDDQAQLAANFPQFFTSSNVSAADYHIAVTTTLTVGSNCTGLNGATCADHEMSGHYTVGANGNDRFLTPASTDPEGQFGENVLVSNARIPDRPTSDGGEGALRGAFNFLNGPKINDPAINGGFLRDNAKLHVILVSDEPDQSRGPTDLYIDFFKNLKGFRNSSLVAVSAIAKADNERCGTDDDIGSARYEEVVSALNGRFQSICAQDWTTSMRALGLDSLGLQVEFFLTRAATASTLSVCVRNGSTTAACQAVAQVGGAGANGYFFDPANNSIVFNPASVPARGSRVEVTYETFCFGP